MGRKEKRQDEKEKRHKLKNQEKRLKHKLNDEQFEVLQDKLINELVADKVANTWNKLSVAFLEAMKNNRIGEERRIKIIMEMKELVAQGIKEAVSDGKGLS